MMWKRRDIRDGVEARIDAKLKLSVELRVAQGRQGLQKADL